MNMRKLLLPLTLLCTLAGCSEATQVIVLIDAQPGIRGDAEALQVKVEGRSARTGAGVVKLDQSLPLEASRVWPIRLVLRPQDDDPTRVFAVEVVANDNGTAIATARLVSSYVEEKTRYVLLLLEDACRGNTSCRAEDDETCRAGECVAAYVAPEKLSSNAEDAVQRVEDAGSDAMTDAGEDASDDAGSDAMTLDAGNDATIDAGCNAPELCNGLDDDCDDNIDEELTRVCGTNVGACEAGSQTCNAGDWSLCDDVAPGTEDTTCDGVDSDCDGRTDESLGCVLANLATAIDTESDAINDIVAGSGGSLFATGYTCTAYSSESCDLWVGRFDATGVPSWVNRYDNGFTGYQYFLPDVGHGIALDPQGNLVALGHMCNSGTEESCDLWLRKLTPDGNAVPGWNLMVDVNMTSNDQAADVAVAADGSVYIAATISVAYAPTDIWIRKYNSDGTVAWTETFNSLGSNSDGVLALAVDREGDLLVAGFTNNNQAWLRKYAPDKTIRWTRTHTSPSTMNAYARATGIATDSDNNVFMVGEYDSTAAITWIRKYDVDGNLVGSRDIPVQSNANKGPSIAVDADDNVVIALSFYASTANGRDLQVTKYNNALDTEVWNRVYDNAGADEYGHSVTTNAQRDVIIGGAVTLNANSSTLDSLIRSYGP